MQSFLLIFFPILFALSLLAIGLALRFMESDEKRKLTSQLRTAAGDAPASRTVVIVDHSRDKHLLSRILAHSNLTKQMEAKLQQAGLDWSVSRLVLMMGGMAGLGALLGIRLANVVPWAFSSFAFAGLFGILPYLYVSHARKRRLAAFESQFPEALDFLARSMRAGHAFTVSLEMLSKDSPDPVGLEFRRMFNEQNLGCPQDVAFAHLVARVPLTDLRFFVSTVLLQKETGGNLSEILNKLAAVIRERFQLKGQVRAASAHGRLTALVLGILPIVLSLGLFVVAPGYLQSMAKDPDGRYMILGAIVGQVLGYYCMRRIINIRV